MKMLPQHFEKLKSMISVADTAELRQSYRDRGLTDQRYRWDLTYVRSDKAVMRFICDELYQYLDDTHIDTALRKIIPSLYGASE